MTSEKRIRRAPHDKENPYYIAARDTSQDKTISYDALGMLHYVLSKPDDWAIQPDDLVREKCAIGKVYTILKELIGGQYVERIYHRDDKKRIVMVEYIAHEKPFTEKPKVAKPKMEKPNLEKGNRNTMYRRNNVQKGQSTKGKKPKTTERTHPLFTIKYPSNVHSYTIKHIEAYQGEHTQEMVALVKAWAGDMFASVTEFGKSEGQMYVEVHQELTRLKVPSTDYGTLADYAKTKNKWKSDKGDKVWVKCMLDYVTEYKPNTPPAAASTTSSTNAKWAHDYEEMFGAKR